MGAVDTIFGRRQSRYSINKTEPLSTSCNVSYSKNFSFRSGIREMLQRKSFEITYAYWIISSRELSIIFVMYREAFANTTTLTPSPSFSPLIHNKHKHRAERVGNCRSEPPFPSFPPISPPYGDVLIPFATPFPKIQPSWAVPQDRAHKYTPSYIFAKINKNLFDRKVEEK